jgi:hypothetical protein
MKYDILYVNKRNEFVKCNKEGVVVSFKILSKHLLLQEYDVQLVPVTAEYTVEYAVKTKYPDCDAIERLFNFITESCFNVFDRQKACSIGQEVYWRASDCCTEFKARSIYFT